MDGRGGGFDAGHGRRCRGAAPWGFGGPFLSGRRCHPDDSQRLSTGGTRRRRDALSRAHVARARLSPAIQAVRIGLTGGEPPTVTPQTPTTGREDSAPPIPFYASPEPVYRGSSAPSPRTPTLHP